MADETQVNSEVPSVESEPAINGSVSSSEASNNDVPRESKNARKKRERREKLPNDPMFGASNAQPTEKGSAKPVDPFDFRKFHMLAKGYAPTIEKILDTYFTMRGAMGVFPVGDAATIEPMTCAKYGEVAYYVNDKKETVRGPLQEAFAFHAIVLSGGTVQWIEGFIKKHRNFVSFAAILYLSVTIEVTLKQHRALIEVIERRNAAQAQETYAASSVVDARDTVNVDNGIKID